MVTKLKTNIIIAIIVLFNFSGATFLIVFPEPYEKEVIYAGESFDYNGVSIEWFLCESIKLKFNNIVVYIDPNDILEPSEKADYIIITHDHGPHSIPYEMNKISDINTTIIASPVVFGRDYAVSAGSILQFGNISFEFVSAYNINKFRPTGIPFHPVGWGVGVIVDFGVARIYHAGDTDAIPEMMSINTDIAFLPVSGYAWMTAREAATAVEYLKVSSSLKYAIPFHWGYNGYSYTGSVQDAMDFVNYARCSIVMLDNIAAP